MQEINERSERQADLYAYLMTREEIDGYVPKEAE